MLGLQPVRFSALPRWSSRTILWAGPKQEAAVSPLYNLWEFPLMQSDHHVALLPLPFLPTLPPCPVCLVRLVLPSSLPVGSPSRNHWPDLALEALGEVL